MPLDLKFGPLTGDLVDGGNGTFATVATAETMVYHQLVCHENEWWGDDQLGSSLFQLRSLQLDPPNLAIAELKRALGIIVSRGRIDSLQVIAEMQGPTRVVTSASYRDTSTNAVVNTFVTPGGGNT